MSTAPLACTDCCNMTCDVVSNMDVSHEWPCSITVTVSVQTQSCTDMTSRNHRRKLMLQERQKIPHQNRVCDSTSRLPESHSGSARPSPHTKVVECFTSADSIYSSARWQLAIIVLRSSLRRCHVRFLIVGRFASVGALQTTLY